jgi:trans-aconitate methyltransferase
MSQEDNKWKVYYQKIKGRAPRQLLVDALAYFPDETSSTQRNAIDLGCGDGTESALLLARGWNVLAIDGEPAAIQHLMEKVPAESKIRLQTQVAKFKDVLLPPAHLIHASLSIPFCEPEHFPALWDKIAHAIQPGGRFAGQFFGVRDSWVVNKDMTFHTEDQVREMLEPFEIESFHEMDEDGNATSGPKHWHVFTVIARKV